MTEFRIHALSVGGGILGLCPMPGCDGDYAADLAHIRDWLPSLVITMSSRAELVRGGAEDLGSDLNDSGTRWAHMPVVDFGAPSADEAAEWPKISAQALAALNGGGRVLVHCRGGCGRSGMVVLRLMVEAGEDAQTALARLRALRPCAVETRAQLHWATQ